MQPECEFSYAPAQTEEDTYTRKTAGLSYDEGDLLAEKLRFHFEQPTNFGATSFNPGKLDFSQYAVSGGTYEIDLKFSYSFGQVLKTKLTLNIADCTCRNLISLPADLNLTAEASYSTKAAAELKIDNIVRPLFARLCFDTCGTFALHLEPQAVPEGETATENVLTHSVTPLESSSYCRYDCHTMNFVASNYPTTFFLTESLLYSYILTAYAQTSGTDHSDATIKTELTIEVTIFGDCPMFVENAVHYVHWQAWDPLVPLDFIIAQGSGSPSYCPEFTFTATELDTNIIAAILDPAGQDSAAGWTPGSLDLVDIVQGQSLHHFFKIKIEATSGSQEPLEIPVELFVAEALSAAQCGDPFSTLGLLDSFRFAFGQIRKRAEVTKWAPDEAWQLIDISETPTVYQEDREDLGQLLKKLRNCVSECDSVSLKLSEVSSTRVDSTKPYQISQSYVPSGYTYFREVPQLWIAGRYASPIIVEQDTFDFCAPEDLDYQWTFEFLCSDLDAQVPPEPLEFTVDTVVTVQSQAQGQFQEQNIVYISNLDYHKAKLDEQASGGRRRQLTEEAVHVIQLPVLLPSLHPFCETQERHMQISFIHADRLGTEWYALDEETDQLKIFVERIPFLELIADNLVEAEFFNRYLTTKQGTLVKEQSVAFSLDFRVPPCVKASVTFDSTDFQQKVTVPVLNSALTQKVLATQQNENSTTQTQDQEASEETILEPSSEESVSEGQADESKQRFVIVSLPVPSPSSTDCDTYTRSSIEFSSPVDLGESWVSVALDASQLTIYSDAESIRSLQASLTVQVRLRVELLDAKDRELVYDSAETDLQILFAVQNLDDIEAIDSGEETTDQGSGQTTQAFIPVFKEDGKEQAQEVQQKSDKKPIVASLDYVSETGQLRIAFSRPFELQGIGTRRLLLQNDEDASEGDFDSLEATKLQLIQDSIEVLFEASNDIQDPPILSSVNCTSASATAIELSLTFENLLAVSYDQVKPDELSIAFDPLVFKDPKSEQPVNSDSELVVKLPRQINPSLAAAVNATMSTVNEAGSTIATSNAVLNLFLGASLKTLWGMINTLQFVVFFSEWKAQVPANASLAIATFRSIALGEFIPSEWLTNSLREFMAPEPDPEDSTEDLEAQGKSNVLSNMGNMLLFLLLVITIIGLVLLAKRQCKQDGKVQKLGLKLKQKLLYNSLLRFALQSFLKNSIASLTAVSVLSFATGAASFNSVLALLILGVLASFPVLFGCILWRNKAHLDQEATKAKIGSLYLGIRTKGLAQYLYSSVFLCRRLLYAVLTVSFLKQPNLCIHAFLVANVLNSAYLSLADPHDSATARIMEQFNDQGLQLVTYHLALFPLALSFEDEEALGFSMIGCVCAIFLANLFAMIWVNRTNAKRKLQLRNMKAANVKRMEARKERMLAQAQEQVLLEAKYKRAREQLYAPSEPSQRLSVVQQEADSGESLSASNSSIEGLPSARSYQSEPPAERREHQTRQQQESARSICSDAGVKDVSSGLFDVLKANKQAQQYEAQDQVEQGEPQRDLKEYYARLQRELRAPTPREVPPSVLDAELGAEESDQEDNKQPTSSSPALLHGQESEPALRQSSFEISSEELSSEQASSVQSLEDMDPQKVAQIYLQRHAMEEESDQDPYDLAEMYLDQYAAEDRAKY